MVSCYFRVSNSSSGIRTISWTGSTRTILPCLTEAFSFASSSVMTPKVFILSLKKKKCEEFTNYFPAFAKSPISFGGASFSERGETAAQPLSAALSGGDGCEGRPAAASKLRGAGPSCRNIFYQCVKRNRIKAGICCHFVLLNK